MIKDGIEKILELAKPERFDIDGREYLVTNGKLTAIQPPTQKSFQVGSLTAISDYFRSNPDSLAPLSAVVVHVVSPVHVRLMSPVLPPWLDRHAYLEAQSTPKAFPFGKPLDVESFIVALQTFFVPTETTQRLQQLVSSLSDQASIDYKDDGIGQQVTAKTGIARVGTVDVPNPVKLAPYRTFNEVRQPESAFVFRIQKGGAGPQCVLHEADGGNWQQEAVGLIRDWLTSETPEGTVILA
jgi:hypothetical protein